MGENVAITYKLNYNETCTGRAWKIKREKASKRGEFFCLSKKGRKEESREECLHTCIWVVKIVP
jgi:hypothetical protein